MPSIFRNYLWVPWRCHPSFAPTSLISWVPLRALSPLCILLGLFSLYCLHFLPKRVLTYHNFNYYQCAYAIEVSKISNQTFLVNSKHIYQASYLAVFMEHLTYISKLIISANKLPRLFSSWLNRTSKCWVVQARSRGGSVLPSPTSPSPTSTKSCRLLLFWSVRNRPTSQQPLPSKPAACLTELLTDLSASLFPPSHFPHCWQNDHL